MKYEPKFKIINNHCRKSLWVIMPSKEEFRIWDLLTKECTYDVKKAIIHAFELGLKAHKMLISQVDISFLNSDFIGEEEK